MPELPDVEISRRYVNATALQQKIERVHVRDAQILDGATPQVLGRWLDRRRFIATRRHGKHLFLELDNHRWLGLHFGMTGRLQYYKLADQEPEYVQALIIFANGYRLAYALSRKLGRLRLLEDPDAFIAEQELGPDALDDDLNRCRDR